jgi:hypothetical protein
MGEQVQLREAARRLGISADTVRRRMKAGQLVAEKRPTPQGGVWWITLPDDDPLSPVPSTGDTSAASDIELVRLRAELDGAQALIDALRNDRDAWREQAVASREAEAQLRVLVQQAQSLAGALPATVGDAGTQAYVSPTPPTRRDQTTTKPAPRSWWQRLTGSA